MVLASNVFRSKDSDTSAVVGLKLFMDSFSDEQLQIIMKTLASEDFRGALVNHCEDKSKLKPNIFFEGISLIYLGF